MTREAALVARAIKNALAGAPRGLHVSRAVARAWIELLEGGA